MSGLAKLRRVGVSNDLAESRPFLYTPAVLFLFSINRDIARLYDLVQALFFFILPRENTMDAKLILHHDEMSEEDTQNLIFSLTQTLNQETDLAVKQPEETAGLGSKGDAVTIGEIFLAALSSGTVVALLQVLKSYVERKPMLRIEIETVDGDKVKIEAEHLRPGQIEQTTQAVKQLCEHSGNVGNG